MPALMEELAAPVTLSVVPVPIQWRQDLPIFASDAFLRSVGDEYGWLGGTDASGAVRCILPYTILRKPGFRFVRFRLETVTLGNELSLEEEGTFLASAVEYFRSTGADVIIPSGNTAIFRTYPAGAIAAPYGTVIKDLTQTEEQLLSDMRPTHRQNIRKAQSVGVEIKSGEAYNEIAYELVEQTMRRSGSKFQSAVEFKTRLASFGENVRIMVAIYQGEVHGCMVAPFSHHTAYNCYAGSRPEPVRGAMHLLHWEAMREFRKLGVRRFDFQGVRVNPEKGSKQEGILSYKKGFGGQLVQGYLWKQALRPLKGMAYSWAARLLQGGDIVDREQHKLQA